MKKYNISKPEKYMKDGVEKTYWTNVGTMTDFMKEDGSISRIIEIPAIGLKANIFAIEPKEEPTVQIKETSSKTSVQPDGSEPIDSDEIPF